MNKLLPLLLSFSALLLAGCKINLPPIESAFTADYVTADGPFKTELRPDQLRAATEWFERNKSGWKFQVTDMAPGPTIVFKHRGGRVTGLRLLGNEVWVRNHVKLLTPEDRALFAGLFDPQNHLPVFAPPTS